MKKFIFILFWTFPLWAIAQEKTTINFSKAISWIDLVAEAKNADKPIFLDAFTTWCVPCAKMDIEVFTDSSVAAFMNENFISMRVQMDSSKKDNDFLKKWRHESAVWKSLVTSYPCFLFFTADGQFAGLETGYLPPQDFLAVLKRSSDPNSNYPAQIQRFKEGKLDAKQLYALACWAKQSKDPIAMSVAKEYKKQHLDSLPLDSLITPNVARFSMEFYDIFSPTDQFIKYLNKYPDYVDSLVHQHKYAIKLSDYLITRDYINNVILPGGKPIQKKPNWDKIQKQITRDFDKNTADRIILDSKILWARRHKRFEEAARYEFEKIDRYGIDTTATGRAFFNNMIYGDIFPNVDNTILLKKAIVLMRHITNLDKNQTSTYFDTYASLLYKIGKKEEALKAENTAIELAKQQNNQTDVKFYTDVIDRMKKGEEIWKTN